jgi:hypothetical protein
LYLYKEGGNKRDNAMEKGNISALKTLILLGMIIAPSFYLFSSYSPRHIPAGKRPLGYVNPRARRVARRRQVLVKPVQEEVVLAEPAQVTQVREEIPPEDEREESVEPTISQSGEKDVQVASPSAATPGMLTALYATIAPIILITLNKALEGGIGAFTKLTIKRFMVRNALKEAQQEAYADAEKNVISKDFDRTLMMTAESLDPLGKKYDLVMDEIERRFKWSDQEKIDFQFKENLQAKKIDPDTLKKQTSVSHIVSQGVYAGFLSTAIPMFGSLVGLLATVALQTLMPSK